MMYEFFVPGIPKGQPRVKAYSRGGRTGVFDPGTANGWKASVALAGMNQRPSEPISSPVEVRALFLFPRPKKHLDRQGIVKDGAPAFHVQKPDIDNALKAIMDALTDVRWWNDDAQVWRVCAERGWSDNLKKGPGAVIQILT